MTRKLQGHVRSNVYKQIYLLMLDVHPYALTCAEIMDKEELPLEKVAQALHGMRAMGNVISFKLENESKMKYRLSERGFHWASILRIDENG